MKALGLVETKGMVGAIEAADVALKTAQVELINKVHTKGGLVCIEIEGDVAAVKAAVEAAVTATKNLGVYIGSHVIPRPDDSVEKIINRIPTPSEKTEVEKKDETPVVEAEPEIKIEVKEEVEEKVEEKDLRSIEEEIEEINEILKVSKNKKVKNKSKK